MAEKNIASRIVHKHDTEANWLKATSFIPKQGEIIVYDADSTYSYERFKIGDGTTVVSSLPFADTNKMDKNNPTGTGSFSMHRKGDTDIGLYSVAIGYNNTASGKYSEAHGYNTTSTNEGSHTEGHSTTASGYASHAEGLSTKALAGYAHAEGYYTTADAMAAHTEGCYTKAIGAYQHVQGQYNITNSTYAHIVGNGTDENNRSNAHTLKWDGTAWFAGDVKVGGTGQDDEEAKTLATTDYVDDLATDVQESLNKAEEASETATEAKTIAEGKAPAYSYDTTDLTAGSSALTTGKLYFVYE